MPTKTYETSKNLIIMFIYLSFILFATFFPLFFKYIRKLKRHLKFFVIISNILKSCFDFFCFASVLILTFLVLAYLFFISIFFLLASFLLFSID